MMGGGYSLRSNRYGLGIDNVVRFQVVLPNGEVTEVDENDSRKDLFEALKVSNRHYPVP
jgi:FAD/FMN-containing dehydrogenase